MINKVRVFIFFCFIAMLSIGSTSCRKQKNVSVAGEVVLFDKLTRSQGPEGVKITLYQVDVNAPATFQVTSGTGASYDHMEIASIHSNADGTFNFGTLKLMHKERHFLLIEEVPSGYLNIAPFSAYVNEGFYSQGKFYPDEDLYFKIPISTTAEVKIDLEYHYQQALTKNEKKTVEIVLDNYQYEIYQEVHGDSYQNDTTFNLINEEYGIIPTDNFTIIETDYFTIPPTVTETYVSMSEGQVYSYPLPFP